MLLSSNRTFQGDDVTPFHPLSFNLRNRRISGASAIHERAREARGENCLALVYRAVPANPPVL